MIAGPSPLRVLHLNSLLTGGGTDDQCIKLVQGLGKLGVDARLAGPDGREFSKTIRDLGLPFHPTPPEGLAKLRFILAAARIIRREQIQIVHAHHGRDLWPTILAARLSGIRPKIVLTRHLAKSPSSWPSRRFLLGQVDALIACSHFVAHVLKEGHYEPDSPIAERRSRPPLIGDHSKIHVIYGGIDTERFRPMDASTLRAEWGLKPGDYAFGMVGGYALPFGKGQREFLQAAARIHTQVPQARFLIIGRGNMADLLRADIQQLGLNGKAWLTPYCNDMPAAMNALDCLVHSQIGTEAMPGVVCEAQACGRPVIASDLDGIPEAMAIGGLGKLVRAGSVDELAEAMAQQLGHPIPLPTHCQEMHRRVESLFSLATSARCHADFYRGLLAPAG
ncbi:MAG: glycosyltransferase [Verrucomicrobia bacterium]|jgi:glycosyltransferase involved in cell wall biosynthesis|nr:glycosyltransferase [Verrucomicrobiota bacterium]